MYTPPPRLYAPIARTRAPRGFTLLEVMLAVGIVGLLAAIALPAYTSYAARARAAELVLQFDAVRTGVSVQAKAGGVSDDCGAIAARVDPARLQSPYAAMDLAFEAVPGGYTPMLRFCANVATQGTMGVAVARETHHVLSRVVSLGRGTVIGESAVSFAAPAADGALLCKTPPPAALLAVACGGGAGGGGGGSAVAKGPTPATSAPVAASAAVAVAPLPAASVYVPPPLPKVTAQVMKFAGTGAYARPVGNVLKTDGDLKAFTLDMTFIGDGSVVASSGGQGPVMFNYGSDADGHNAISLWNPRSLTIALQNRNLDTGLNVIDGQTHRVAVTWDSATGTVAVYDNGRQVRTFDNIAKGGTIAGGGTMVLAHKDNGGGNYRPNEGFAGQIFRASLASRALTAAEAVRPVNQVLDAASGLLIDVTARNGQTVDTTGRHQIETGGTSIVNAGVEGNLVQ